MRIGLVIWSLFETQGGLEKVGCALAEALLSRGHEVVIFYNDSPKKLPDPVYPTPEGATLTGLPLDSSPCDLDRARQCIQNAGLDVLAALFAWESLLWFPWLLRDGKLPLVISEHNTPERINSTWNAYERHACLACADHIHVLLESFIPAYPEELRDRITAVGNAVPEPEPLEAPQQHERKILLAAGRLEDSEKQFSLLIKSFALLKDRFPEWDLRLCGQGASYKQYQNLARELGVEARTSLPGLISDMRAEYKRADLFCIPSRLEGFGLVTTEACSHGLPVVGFAACPGTNEIIVHGENGLLVGEMTPESLAAALAELMASEPLRHAMGQKAHELVARYAPERIYDAWEKILREATQTGPNTRIAQLRQKDGDIPEMFAAAKELLNRPHPFDRSAYIKKDQKKLPGEKPLFTPRQIKNFHKKHKKYGVGNKKNTLLRHILRVFKLC